MGRPVLGSPRSSEPAARGAGRLHRRRPLRAGAHGAGGGGPDRPRHARGAGGAHLPRPAAADRPGAARAAPAIPAASSARSAIWSRCISCWASRASAPTIPTTTPTPCSRPCWAAACRPGCSRRSARSAGSATASTPSPRAYQDGGLFGIYAGTGPEKIGELVPVMCDELCKVADDVTDERSSAAPAPSSRPAC